MSTISIAVGGKAVFNWSGDAAAIENILERFPLGSHGVGLPPEVFADNCVAYLAKGELLSAEAVGQEMQMMGVIWRILTANTGNAEHPGKVMDYAAFTDFNVDIEIGPQNYVLHIEARSKLDA
jgi:hypothetical protein